MTATISACAALTLCFVPPSAAAVEPQVQVGAPDQPVIADWPFAVTSNWSTDGQRSLFVVLIRASSCGQNLITGLALDPRGLVVVPGDAVAGSGSRVDEVTITTVGEYLVCGYLQTRGDPAAPADAVTQSPRRVRITTFPDLERAPASGKQCGRVRGARRISQIRAYSVGCGAARSLARRWARADPPRRVVAGYCCRTRRRAVVCTASERKVSFRVRAARNHRRV